VQPCLDALSDHALGIVSNGSARQQRMKLEQTGILSRFAVVVGSEDVGEGKPSPAIFLAACRQLGRRPEECVYVGDRLAADARASAAVGMRGIWLDRGRSGTPCGVEVIHSLADLPAKLGLPEAPVWPRAVAITGIASTASPECLR
jgi:putative hydrolase of the HAD superfamily